MIARSPKRVYVSHIQRDLSFFNGTTVSDSGLFVNSLDPKGHADDRFLRACLNVLNQACLD